MTTYPSNRNQDWTATQAAPWQTPSPDAATMAAYYPPTAARQAYGPAFGQPPMAWSAEQPEFNSAPAPYPTQQQPWYARRSVLAFAGAGFVAAAAAGLFGALHGSSSSTPVNTAAQSAPAPAAAPAPAPAPRTGTRACSAAGGAQLPVDVSLDGVERRIFRARKPSDTAADSAGPARTAQR